MEDKTSSMQKVGLDKKHQKSNTFQSLNRPLLVREEGRQGDWPIDSMRARWEISKLMTCSIYKLPLRQWKRKREREREISNKGRDEKKGRQRREEKAREEKRRKKMKEKEKRSYFLNFYTKIPYKN